MKKIKSFFLIIILIMGAILFAQEANEPVSEEPLPEEPVSEEPADATATDAPPTASRELGIGAINEAYEAGADAIKDNQKDAAIGHFQRAAEISEQFLSGIIGTGEEAQAKYFRGLALYYWGKLAESSDKLDEASLAFTDAGTAFTNIDKLGRFYLDSKYRKGLCSFRQYQLSNVENVQIAKLSAAYGDFRGFLEDPALEESREQMTSEIEQAKYLAAFCLFKRGAIKMFQVSERTAAKNDLNTAAGYFAELNDAQNEQIAVLSRLMEGECHYYLGRLYMQVHPDEWSESNLSNQSRDEAIISELETAESRINAAKSAMGAFAALNPYVTFSLYINGLAKGAAGETGELGAVLANLADQSVTGEWTLEKDMRAADAQLLRYFSGETTPGAAIGSWQSISGRISAANYWVGWVKYIEAIEQTDNYSQASSQFMNFLGRAGGTTRESIMKADAKFREAECTFWDATLSEQAPALQQAKASYQALISSSGAYAKYLPQEILNQASVRIQIIEVQERMQKGTADINRVITNLRMQGLELPDDAKAYLNFGRYFLEKANREYGQARLLDVGLAIGLFGYVEENGSVAAAFRNEAKFLQGVAYIKKATATESDDEAKSAMQDAKKTLDGVSTPLSIEAKYAVGVGYFNIEDRSSAQSALNTLKDSYIRPAYVYGMVSGNCVTKGTYLKKVIASTPRSDTWHMKAQQGFDKLDCAGNVPPQSGGLKTTGSPITYESLADPKAQMDELRAQALLMWQKVSEGKKVYPIDQLIPDLPPKTTITVEFIIKGTDGKEISGEHRLIIDGDEGLAEKISGSTYRATLSRATHGIVVKMRGYYRFDESMSITEEQDVSLNIKKAVRYVKDSDMPDSDQPMAITSSGDWVIIANNDKRVILRRDSGGKLISSVSYDDIKVSAVTGLAVDGDYLLVVDGRAGQIKLITADGGDVQPIAVKGESYGGNSLVKPSAAIAVEGKYYIVDTGNSRVVVFEGVNYRSEFGDTQLEHPIGIAYRASDRRFLITDIVLGKVFVFSLTGEMIESLELPEQKTPGAIFVDPDGFIFVADYVSGDVYKYTSSFESLGRISSDITAPTGLSQIGSGPSAKLYIAGREAVAILKGAWDNAYMPE